MPLEIEEEKNRRVGDFIEVTLLECVVWGVLAVLGILLAVGGAAWLVKLLFSAIVGLVG